MSKEDELIRLTLQQKYKSPVGVRENEETLYANVAHEPLMLDNVRQIEILQIHDAIKNKINYKRFCDEKVTPSSHKITISESFNGYITTDVDKALSESLITIRVYPDEGYELKELIVKSGLESISVKQEEDYFTFIMPDHDVIIYSTFKMIEYSITIIPSINGYIVSNALISIAGEDIILTAVPNKGYELSEITVLSGETVIETSKIEENDYLFTMPYGNVDVYSTFENKPPEPFTSQCVFGTFRLWGDSEIIAIEFGDFAFGIM